MRRHSGPSSIWKSTFREIKSSFGRFAAIMAIIAMGVGFFAGLKVTKSAMIVTTQRYLEEMQLYDYRILSTMGFEEEDAALLAQQEGVRSAEGSVSFDIIYRNAEGNEGVVKTHSLTEGANGVKILSGRMPEEPWECVADANLFSKDDIGSTILISEANEEEDREHFAYEDYTIVGIVQSSLYIQFERGNTSLGDGKVDGFLVIPREGFDTDYDTEIYVKFEEDFPLYSEAYDDFLEEREPIWEDLAEQAAYGRYDRIITEAEEEIADAWQELTEEKTDAEQELADARQELDDAEKELADAAVELEDGRIQLADGRKEIRDAEKTLAEKSAELEDAKVTLAEKEAELADARVQYEDGLAEWEDAYQQKENAQRQMQEQQAELNAQKEQLQAQEAELLAGEAQLDAAEAQTEEQLVQKEAELDAAELELDAQEAYLTSLGIPISENIAAQIAAGRAQIDDGRAQIAAARQEFAVRRAEVEAGKLAIAQGYDTIAGYQQQIDSAYWQIRDANVRLNESYEELQSALAQITDGEQAIADARVEIADGEQQLLDARKEIADAKKTLAEKEIEYEDGLKEYEDGLAEYQDGLAEYEEGVQELTEEVADAEIEIADAEEELADLEEPDSYLLGRDTNVGYVLFENDSSIVEGIANIFPIFFFLVAALVCITTMNRMVEEQRTQIGVLKALGYGDGTIMLKYLTYSGSAALIGAVLGFAGGTWLFPRVIWTAYGMMYRVDTLLYVFDWNLAVISLVVSLLCSAGATWFSCRYELFQVAAQLMRPKAPRAGKRVFLERIPLLWKRLSFLKKVSVRNIFRYKKRLFMMVLGISGCTALLVTGFGIKDSIANIARQQFEEVQIFDVGVVTSDALTDAAMTELEEVLAGDAQEMLRVMEITMDLVTEDTRKAINLVVTETGTDLAPYVDLHTPDGEPISFPEKGEAVISRKISESYDLHAGDTFLLQNEDMESISVTVSAVCQNFIYNYIYLGSDTYEEGMERAPEYKSLYVNARENVDVHTLAADIMKQDRISSVTVNEDVKERFSSMMDSLNLIVVVVILCAAGLAFIVLYNLTNINITERIREIATIKVLGFYKKETCAYVFRENMVLTALGIVPGLLLGYLLHQVVMHQIVVDMVAFDIHVRPISYVYSMVLTYAFAWLVDRLMGGKLDHVSMTESLKSVD